MHTAAAAAVAGTGGGLTSPSRQKLSFRTCTVSIPTPLFTSRLQTRAQRQNRFAAFRGQQCRVQRIGLLLHMSVEDIFMMPMPIACCLPSA